MKRAAAWCLTACLLLAACAAPAEPEAAEEGTLIYYLVPEEDARGGDRIRAVREQLDLPEEADDQDAARAIVERLLSGPSEEPLESPLPRDVGLLSVEVKDRMAYVDFSAELGELAGVELAMADYCLTLSLTALEGVRAVIITAQSRPVGQQPKRVFYERDVLLSSMDDVLQTVEVSLYFLNADGALAEEKRVLSLYEGQTLAESLVAALLEGPENRDLLRAIPEGFAVNYVRVDNGVCYVSLPAASLELLPEEAQVQEMILWSLAESLYSLEPIEEIRLLVDGEALEFFGQIPVENIAVRAQG